MIYASLIAMRQDDLKRLVAYSSIAHMGLMCLAIFATDKSGMQGVMMQMFNSWHQYHRIVDSGQCHRNTNMDTGKCLSWAGLHKKIRDWLFYW